MSDTLRNDSVGRFRKVYPSIWRHPGFVKLTAHQQRIALYILSGPQTTSIGLFFFSVATAAEDLRLDNKTFGEGLANLSRTFGWIYNREARQLYIPSWWRFNAPENVNVLKGNLKILSELQPSALTDAFSANLADLHPDLHETFIQTCAKRLAKHPGNQEHYQEHDPEQEHEREQAATQKPRAAKSGNEDAGLVKIVDHYLTECGTNHPIEEMVDSVQWIAKQKRKAFDKDQIVQALASRLPNGKAREAMA